MTDAGQVSLLSEIRDILSGEEFPCPGGHRRDGKPLELDDLGEEVVMVEIDGKKVDQFSGEMYVSEGDCPKTITVFMDNDDPELGSKYQYPVATGPCAEALRLDEDADYSNSLWTRVTERAYLLKRFDALLSRRRQWNA